MRIAASFKKLTFLSFAWSSHFPSDMNLTVSLSLSDNKKEERKKNSILLITPGNITSVND